LLLGAPFALATLLVFVLAKDRLRSAALALGALAGGAVIATPASFALAASATEGRWMESGNELVFALVGFGVLVRGSRNARSFAAGGLGLLALAVGLSKLPVLLHGVVLSALPATPTRLAVATALWAGAAATVTGLTVFFTVLDEPPAIPAPDDRPRAGERALD
jgi:hypothetical protein